MTLVIALKVGDGVVLGADSASTIVAGSAYHNSYFNAEKLFNVRKGIPVGALTYGLGGLAGRSVSSLAKDLRSLLADETNGVWYIDPASYSVELVATRYRSFFYDELFVPQFAANLAKAPAMGFIVAGFSAAAKSGEIWEVDIINGQCQPPHCLAAASARWGAHWQGEIEALQRLVRGWSMQTANKLAVAGMPGDQVMGLLDAIQPLVHETMPIQDAIDLVHYLVDVTCGFSRFSPGAATVAQPIDIAAITPHEGFRWVRRKHYYSAALNTPSTRHLP